MDNPFDGRAVFDETKELTEHQERIREVPQSTELLSDGTEVIVTGDPQWAAQFNHQQGDNSLGYEGTCGLVSCEELLREAGMEVTEDDVVRYAHDHGLCETGANPEMNGGTTVTDQARILSELGLPAHPEILYSIEDLAGRLEDGQGTIIAVNAGVLWNDPAAFGSGETNHAIVATGVARDAQTGEVAGFYINDSGTGKSAQFIPVEDMQMAWLDPGGMVVTTYGCVY